MINNLGEISIFGILCFPIEYAQTVLWPSFVGDLIELVEIKWVGGGASNKASERAGQHLWVGWGQIQLQRPLKLPLLHRCCVWQQPDLRHLIIQAICMESRKV